jgi:hypothetical protein
MDIINTYIAAWNETDPHARRVLVELVWGADARYVDPLVVAEGKEAIDATIAAVQQQFPGYAFRLSGPVDSHHDLARFTWELGPDGEAPVVIGFDVAEMAGDGRIRSVHGFLDKVPG